MRVITIVFLFLFLSGCGFLVEEDVPIQAMEKAGYTDVEIIKSSVLFSNWNGCGEDDDVMFKAQGTGRDGKIITATICCGGVFKGCTIRF